MSIASEITRLQGVKADILQAIADKGVTVPVGSALDDCPQLIADIPSGGGGTLYDYDTDFSNSVYSDYKLTDTVGDLTVVWASADAGSHPEKDPAGGLMFVADSSSSCNYGFDMDINVVFKADKITFTTELLLKNNFSGNAYVAVGPFHSAQSYGSRGHGLWMFNNGLETNLEHLGNTGTIGGYPTEFYGPEHGAFYKDSIIKVTVEWFRDGTVKYYWNDELRGTSSGITYDNRPNLYEAFRSLSITAGYGLSFTIKRFAVKAESL